MDRGTVLSGQNLYTGNLLEPENYGTVEDFEDGDVWRDPNTIFEPARLYIRNNNFTNASTAAGGGVLHGQSFRWPLAKNIQLTVHTGKEDQQADQTLFKYCKLKRFFSSAKILQRTTRHYYYWIANHKLLDTAYVVTRDGITAEDERSPDLSFVVRGKFVNCFKLRRLL